MDTQCEMVDEELTLTKKSEIIHERICEIKNQLDSLVSKLIIRKVLYDKYSELSEERPTTVETNLDDTAKELGEIENLLTELQGRL